jgi:hypothetical protein
MLVAIEPSKMKTKKYTAIFYDGDKKVKTIHFGSAGMSDYTIHKDDKRKERYLKRHEKNENWDDYMTAGALSRWLLWSKKTFKSSLSEYLKKFNLKLKK